MALGAARRGSAGWRRAVRRRARPGGADAARGVVARASGAALMPLDGIWRGRHGDWRRSGGSWRVDPASGDADGGSWLLDEAPLGGAAAAVGCSGFGPAALLGGMGWGGGPPSRLGAMELVGLLARRGGGARPVVQPLLSFLPDPSQGRLGASSAPILSWISHSLTRLARFHPCWLLRRSGVSPVGARSP